MVLFLYKYTNVYACFQNTFEFEFSIDQSIKKLCVQEVNCFWWISMLMALTPDPDGSLQYTYGFIAIKLYLTRIRCLHRIDAKLNFNLEFNENRCMLWFPSLARFFWILKCEYQTRDVCDVTFDRYTDWSASFWCTMLSRYV